MALAQAWAAPIAPGTTPICTAQHDPMKTGRIMYLPTLKPVAISWANVVSAIALLK